MKEGKNLELEASPEGFSRYSLLLSDGANHYIYSTRNGCLVKLSARLLDAIKTGHAGNKLNGALTHLKERKFLATAEEDDEFLMLLESRYLTESFRDSHLSLTVLPTERCNLRCPYCFEGEKRSVDMAEETVDRIVSYIRGNKSLKSWSLTWFGGEPTLRPDIMEMFLERTHGENMPELGDHSIVTNGTLFNQKLVDLFTRYPLDSIQITLDGKKAVHDTKRFFASGKGTYEIILANLDKMCAAFPKTHFSIRVNVDNNNREDYVAVFNEVSDLLSKTEVSFNVYPGILKNTGSEVDGKFFCGETEKDFYLDLKKSGIDYHGLPRLARGGCTATCSSAMVISADGTIYRCWEEVGKPSLSTGSILEDRITCNTGRLARYLIKGNHYNDPRCRECAFLPVCGGGCPRNRVEGKTESACTVYSRNSAELLKRVLEEAIESKSKKTAD